MHQDTLVPIKPKREYRCIGNKAENIASLMENKGIKVPKTWVVPWSFFDRYSTLDGESKVILKQSCEAVLDADTAYAVRSSSNLEDDALHSCAGLFRTELNIVGIDQLIDAIIRIRNQTRNLEVQKYFEYLKINDRKIQMAVIIQEMVPPKWSGVVFSQNPMTGANELIMEIVPGEGTALVQNGITPERWVFQHGNCVAEPDISDVPMRLIQMVHYSAQRIISKMKTPIDLEWVFDGKEIQWVQMRKITTLNAHNVFSNRLSRDMMPGMIHPLIWSINVPLINSVWLKILEELVGKLPIKPEDLAKSFFYRSYFNMGTMGKIFATFGFPSEGLEMMMGIVPKQEGRSIYRPTLRTLKHIPRLIKFIFDKWNFHRRIKTILPSVLTRLEEFSANPELDSSAETLLFEVERLKAVVSDIVYLNIVTPLLVSMFVRLLEQQLKTNDIDIVDIDLLVNLSEIDQYNPNVAIGELKVLYDDLTPEEKATISPSNLPVGEFSSQFNQFILDFGHYSDNSNNFMAVPWRENPERVIDLIKNYEVKTETQENRIVFEDLNIAFIRRRLAKIFYKKIRQYSMYREDISKVYVYAYGLFRPYIFRIADWMIARNIIEEKMNIFFFSWDEICKILTSDDRKPLISLVESRKADMQGCKDIDLPEVIYGEEPPPVITRAIDRMKGTPTSKGYYTGPIKVIHDNKDFSKVLDGDVIVIPYSDVGWTPLFSKAGAVIAESGGMLSHSAIIAREYQIPAIVSVNNCMKLPDHQIVNVNGYTGEIIIIAEKTKEA